MLSRSKKGDLVIGFITAHDQSIVAICDIVEGLHMDEDEGEVISFRKIENLKNSVPIKELENNDDLKECKPVINRQASLFPLAKEEFDAMREIVDSYNPNITEEEK